MTSQSSTFNHLIIIIPLVIICTSCFRKARVSENTILPDHHLFDSLLKKHVNDDGLVNYDGLRGDSSIFRAYLNELRQHTPGTLWSDRDRLAYWINVYNAFTIKLILDHNPKHSIKEITKINLPYVYSPWQINFIDIDGVVYNLDDIEQGIIRNGFDLAHAHFALTKASISSPKLRREAYMGWKLDKQLSDQAREFLTHSKQNQLSAEHLKISKILKWYESDFSSPGNIIDYLNQFSPIVIQQSARVEYLEYDWTLNSQ